MTEKVVKLTKRNQRRAGGAGNSRADYVKERIREAIQTGRYQPGDRIRESEVAEWLEVSRTPVREALRRLESEGLVGFESWRGVVVADLDRQQVSELYAMREVLEGAAARLAARHIGDAEIELLEALLARADARGEDPDALAAINRQFHETIYGAAHNRYLTQTLEQLRNSLALLRGTTFAVPGRAETAAAEHRMILEAIRNRDPDAAESAARTHIAASQRARLQLLIDTEGTKTEETP
jgi:DNA-binding GntR family transcriptional regulator